MTKLVKKIIPLTKLALASFGLALLGITTAEAESLSIGVEAFELSEKGAEFVNFKGRRSVRVNGGIAKVKGANFKNGIIEYDIWMEEARGFSGVYFRTNHGNSEYFYLRSHLSGKPDANQYVPEFNHNSSWQIFNGDRYSAPTVYNYGSWIHVKLAVKDDKMDVFIDSDTPVLHIEDLLTDSGAGGIEFGGDFQDFYYSNISYTSTGNVTLSGTAKPKKEMAPGQIRAFDVATKPVDSALIEGKAWLDKELVSGQSWTRLKVGETGVANLSRVSPLTRGANTLLVRLQITAAKAQTIQLKYGFSDRVTVFQDGHAIAHGDDSYASRDYRFLGTVGLFDSVFVPLKTGDNEVIFAVSESFGGWAFLAAADNIPGVTIK